MWEVAYEDVSVAGLKYRLDTVLDVIEEMDGGRQIKLRLEREPDNQFDSNAIKVVARPDRHIGYLPAIVSESVAYRRLGDLRAEIVSADIDEALRVRIEIRVLARG